MSMLTEKTFTDKDETREIVEEVLEHAFESVCSTMGPNGRYVVINEKNLPKVTKDGVSVAKALDFNEARRNMIAKIITEPSVKTDLEVGDGTTTTVFMTYQLFKRFGNRLNFKSERYLNNLIEDVIEHITTLIIPGDINSDLFRNMLLTSSNYEDEIVDKVLEIYRNYDNPNITLKNSPNLPKDEISYTKDIVFDGQFAVDQYVPKSGKMSINSLSAAFVLVDGTIQHVDHEILSMIEEQVGTRPVIIIARNFEPMAISNINAFNQNLGALKYIPYKINAAGSLGTQTIGDLAALTTMVPIYNISDTSHNTIIINPPKVVLTSKGIVLDKDEEFISVRAEDRLEEIIPRYEALNTIDRQTPIGRSLFNRVGRLQANNITMSVTGAVPSEATERYYRYEDVMKAAKTGKEFGIIPGIGYGYISAAEFLMEHYSESDEELKELLALLIGALRSQYEHLTGYEHDDVGSAVFIDLVTGTKSKTPENVFDNAAATLTALRGAWSTAKTLSKINNIMGRSNTSYS